jgi:iron(III) transport system permease protein
MLDGIATLPIATPGIVIAVAVIVVWNQPFMPGAIYESQWVLAIAYTIVFLPFGVRYASAAFQAMPPGLDEAGRTSGAGIIRRMYRLILPLVIPAVLSAWALAFAIGMRELENSLIVRPPGTVTISYFMWQSFTQGNPLSGMAMAVLTLCVTSVALVAVRGLVGKASALTV